jgi:hypothetical protein
LGGEDGDAATRRRAALAVDEEERVIRQLVHGAAGPRVLPLLLQVLRLLRPDVGLAPRLRAWRILLATSATRTFNLVS